MRIKVNHITRYTYDKPVAHAVQRLALTPLSFAGQEVINWSIEAPGIDGAPCYTDAFGNIVHLCTQSKAVGELAIIATGEVETEDRNGMIGQLANEPPPRLFLRRTQLSAPDAAIAELAENIANDEPDHLTRLHRLMASVHQKVQFETLATNSLTTGAQAFSAGHGVCQDFTHIFIAMARCTGIPARYVTGYLLLDDEAQAEAQHAWAEAWIAELGWVAFDPANSICPTERYIRLCCGLDAASAAPIKGLRTGIAKENLSVLVDVQQTSQ